MCFLSRPMKVPKDAVLLAYYAWTTVLDIVILCHVWGVFGHDSIVIGPAFSQLLADSAITLETILTLMVVQAGGVLALGLLLRRRDAPKVHFLGLLLLLSTIALLVLLPDFLDADVGIIIMHLESLSHYTVENPTWGVSVSQAQVTIAVAWLATGLARNVFRSLLRYTWAKATWHSGRDPGRLRPSRVARRAAALAHALSFLLVLLPFGPVPVIVSTIISGVAIATILPGLARRGQDQQGLLDEISFPPTMPVPRRVVAWLGVPALVAFATLLFVPYFTGLGYFARLQAANFGGWSFYLWGGVLGAGLLAWTARHLDSPRAFWVFRVIVKIVIVTGTAQIVLNLGFLNDLLAWGWWTTIGNQVHGGGLAPSPGYQTIPHVFAFLWATVLLGCALLLLTRRERASYTPRHVINRCKAGIHAITGAMRGLTFSRTREGRRRVTPPAVILAVIACGWVASTWGYGVPIVLRPHPDVATRISFWTSGSLVPAPYLDVIHVKNNAYNTSARFFSWGNQFTARSGGQYLIDIPGAQYYLSCGPHQAWLNASAMIAYLQRLVDAKVTYWFHGSSIAHLQPVSDLLASPTVNATFKSLVNQVIEGFIFDIENGGSYATFNQTAMDAEHASRAEVVLFAQAMGKKMGFTTVAYTIGDWLDSDNDVATLFRIHDFHPPTVANPVIPPYSMDYVNWMIYRSDQPGPERQIWDPYFSYLHFVEARAYIDQVAAMYPELGMDPVTDFGLSMGVLRPGDEQVFSNTTAGRESFLVELRMANALGISEGVYFYFPYFMNMYSPSDHAAFYDDLHGDWEVRVFVNQLTGALGPPFGTLWDVPNITGTRFAYHVIDALLNQWFASMVWVVIALAGASWVTGAGILARPLRDVTRTGARTGAAGTT